MSTKRDRKLGGRTAGQQGKFAPPKSNARPAWVSKALKLQARGHDYDSIALILDKHVETIKAWIDPHTITARNVEERNLRALTRAEKEELQRQKRDMWRAQKRAQRAAQYEKPNQEN